MSKQQESRELATLFLGMRNVFKHIGSKNKNFNVFSAAQLETLCYIKQSKSPTMTELAKYLNISPPSATNIIDTLVSKGEIERIEGQNDRRRVRISVTKKGDKKLEESMDHITRELADVFSILNHKEIKALKEIIGKVISSVKK